MQKSKKRSDAKSPSRPEQPTIFLDRNLGKHIISRELRNEGISVVVHDDLLDAQASDETWIELVGREGWVAVTRDKNIRYRKAEIDAVRKHGARIVVVRMKDASGPAMAQLLVSNIHKIAKFTADTPAPFVARINKRGELKLADIQTGQQ